MIIRINGSIRRRPAASMTGAIGFFAPHHIMFKILLGIIIIFTASVHLMITHSLSSLIQYTDNADEGSGRLYPSSPISSRVLEERSFPRVSAFLQINTVILRNWTQSRRHVMDMANANVRAKIAMRDDLDLDVVETDTCKLPYTWQKSSFPSCNSIHEFDITSPWSIHSNGWRKLFRIIGNGFWRDVWLIQNDYAIASEKNILKTMRFGHEFSPRNFDRMRRDGVVMERLTKSPFVLNIYSFCGTTSITEYGDGGDIPDALWSEGRKSDLSQIEKLRIGTYDVVFLSTVFFIFLCGLNFSMVKTATQAAIALAAIHNIDREGHPSLAHTDISPAQFIKVKDVYKLNDFNRARFIAYNGNVSCPFSVGSNPGRNRSPEEYNYQPQTEKVRRSIDSLACCNSV